MPITEPATGDTPITLVASRSEFQTFLGQSRGSPASMKSSSESRVLSPPGASLCMRVRFQSWPPEFWSTENG